MYTLWRADYPDNPFHLFGAAHLVVLLMVGVAAFALIRRGSNLSRQGRRRLRLSMATLLILNELLWHIWALTEDLYLITEMLPLHLCSLMVWVSAYALLAEDLRLYGVMYFLGVAGALQALLTPDAGIYGFPHFRFMQTMISHGLVFLAGIYVAAVGGYRPTLRSGLRIFVGLNVYALLVGFINLAVGSNYLYVNRKPETPSIIDLMPAWPWYLVYLELLALAFLALLYVPFLRRNTRIKIVAPDATEAVSAGDD